MEKPVAKRSDGKDRCQQMMWMHYSHHQCIAPSKVTRDGKGYCGTHDPVKVMERAEAREAKRKAERDGYAAQLKQDRHARDLKTFRAWHRKFLQSFRDVGGDYKGGLTGAQINSLQFAGEKWEGPTE